MCVRRARRCCAGWGGAGSQSAPEMQAQPLLVSLSSPSPLHPSRQPATMSNNPTQIQTKLVLLGEAAVGKSSVVLRFVSNEFQENKEPTIGAAFLTVGKRGKGEWTQQDSGSATLRKPQDVESNHADDCTFSLLSLLAKMPPRFGCDQV